MKRSPGYKTPTPRPHLALTQREPSHQGGRGEDVASGRRSVCDAATAGEPRPSVSVINAWHSESIQTYYTDGGKQPTSPCHFPEMRLDWPQRGGDRLAAVEGEGVGAVHRDRQSGQRAEQVQAVPALGPRKPART